MECPSCKVSTPGIIEGNHLWCDKCGTAIRADYQFVADFNNPHSAPRQQLYSRVRRFTKYVRRTCAQVPRVLESFGYILDIYSSYEFAWSCHKQLSKRIYFFAKPVMLQACCQLLGIEADLPSLKDKSRELDQHVDLQKIRNSVTWDMLKLKAIIETKANDCQTNPAP